MYETNDQRDFARRLRKESTDQERRLWSALRKRQLCGCRFRRQYAIGPFVADFECFERRLIVELDGGQHNTDEARRHDRRRAEYLREQGYRVLRFWNDDVIRDFDGVLEVIAEALQGAPLRDE